MCTFFSILLEFRRVYYFIEIVLLKIKNAYSERDDDTKCNFIFQDIARS